MRGCSVEGCDRKFFVHGLCNVHYQRKRRLGSYDLPVRNPEVRFWPKVAIDDPDGCWLWIAGRFRDGYGQFYDGKTGSVRAHRFAYELLVGPIPTGMPLDHLCRNSLCVNPSHLEPVTQAENNRRSGAAKTHCPHGHSYDKGNTYVASNGSRHCRACHRHRERVRKRGA